MDFDLIFIGPFFQLRRCQIILSLEIKFVFTSIYFLININIVTASLGKRFLMRFLKGWQPNNKGSLDLSALAYKTCQSLQRFSMNFINIFCFTYFNRVTVEAGDGLIQKKISYSSCQPFLFECKILLSLPDFYSPFPFL